MATAKKLNQPLLTKEELLRMEGYRKIEAICDLMGSMIYDDNEKGNNPQIVQLRYMHDKIQELFNL